MAKHVAGTRIGPYEVLAKVGEGGMGAVYRAHDSRLNPAVCTGMLIRAPIRPLGAKGHARQAA